MRHRLNGWQRLWVVLASLYLLIVVVITVMVFPGQSNIESDRVYHTLNAIDEYRKVNEFGYEYVSPYSIREKYSDLTDDVFIEKVHKHWGDRVDFSKAEAEYKQRIEALPMERVKAVGYAFLFWIIPVLFIYAFGIAVAWVIRGFRSKNI